MGKVIYLEPWLTRAELAKHYGMSLRWVTYRLSEGLPHARIGNKPRFRVSATDPWLTEKGYMEETG